MEIKLADCAAAVQKRLSDAGFECFVVGGCLRDILMGKTPKDWDLCTSAKPDQIKGCFADKRTVDTGIKHGTVSVVWEGERVEVTTYRTDGSYTDGRHPDRVDFSADLSEDLARRDFTMNAIAWNPAAGVVDPFDGRRAIEERKIIAVGEPCRRFEEDALRILRGLRFASVLGFSLEENTAREAEACRLRLGSLSAERVQEEFSRLVLGENVDEVLSRFSPVLKAAAPTMAEASVGGLPCCLPVRLAKLFPRDTEASLRRLKYDRKTIETASALAGLDRQPFPHGSREIKELLRREGVEIARLYFAARGKEAELQAILDSGACWNLSQLAVTGADLLACGIPPGSEIGRRLNALLEMVISGEARNEREELLSLARGEL